MLLTEIEGQNGGVVLDNYLTSIIRRMTKERRSVPIIVVQLRFLTFLDPNISTYFYKLRLQYLLLSFTRYAFPGRSTGLSKATYEDLSYSSDCLLVYRTCYTATAYKINYTF